MECFCAPEQMAVYVMDLFAIKTAEPSCVCVGVCVWSLSLLVPGSLEKLINHYTCRATNSFVGCICVRVSELQ